MEKSYQTLYLYWDLITTEFSIKPKLSSRWLNRIVSNYFGKTRFYHDLDHVIKCLQTSEVLDYNFKISQTIAIIFHDVVYDTTSKTNEEDSAKIATEFLLDIETPDYIPDVNYYILQTKHNAESYTRAKSDIDLAYFLDIDLSILGSPPEVYKEYYKNIEKEYLYGGVSISDYVDGRYKFLASLLKKDKIFHTKEVQQLYEAKARKNIKAEIKTLS